MLRFAYYLLAVVFASCQALALSVYPPNVRFIQTAGAPSPAPIGFAISAGTGTPTMAPAALPAWLQVTPPAAIPGEAIATVNTAGLAAGTYRQTLTVSAPGQSPGTVTITLVVFSPPADLQTFSDVPANHQWADYIFLLGKFGVTVGCNINPPLYCPLGSVTQGEMAAFVIRSLLGEDFPFPAAPYFSDVPAGSMFFKYIQKMREMQIHSGCGGGQYCPNALVTRAEMAAFMIRSRYLETFTFWQTPRFNDVPSTHPYFKYVQKLYESGVTVGCGPAEYCADSPISRDQMSAFLNRFFFQYKVLPRPDPPGTTPPPGTSTLPAPTGLTATPGDTTVTLRWNAVSGATSYSVYQGLQSGQANTFLTTVTATTYLKGSLRNGVPYYYKVAAVNAAGTGAFTTEVQATPVGSGTPPTPPPPPQSGPGTTDQLTAWRILRQTSFGPTEATISRVRQIGVAAYIDEQLAAAPSVYPDSLIDSPSVDYVEEHVFQLGRTGADQLRQRVAFALSQIMVVSGVEVNGTEAMVRYMRTLQEGALGNFYDLMRNVTLSVAMGEYLDMVNNSKATPGGPAPNENFARELLQLFTIGLTELNPDGTAKLDAQGVPIPTYTQQTVMELSRAFTGWTYPDKVPGAPARINWEQMYHAPMEPVEPEHDTGTKVIFGQTLPPNQTATQDLDQALRIIFNHPNVGPFISRQLIQRLVTSDPSPQYVRDVAAVFNNNGSNVRGDLKAVVRAILTHAEAASGKKLEEPMLFILGITRALQATVTDHPYLSGLSAEMGQRVLFSPSVFNYFSPSFRIPNVGAVAPEFQIYTTVTALTRANFVVKILNGHFGDSVKVDLTSFTSQASNPDALIDRVANLFLGGRLPTELRTQIKAAMAASSSNQEKATTALYMILSSPHHQITY